MAKITEFLKKHRYIFIWTFCYVVIVWAVMLFLFNFDIFIKQNWITLAHAQLHGFAGFAFGILILSAVPIYIATTAVIARTQKPLFILRLPKFMQPVFENSPKESDKDTPATEPEQYNTMNPATAKKTMPTELHNAFIHARSHIGPVPKSNFDISNITKTDTSNRSDALQSQGQTNDQFPIPNDFDISPNGDDFGSDVPTFTPVFSDIDFDSEEKDNTNPGQTGLNESTDDLVPVINFLTAHGTSFTTEKGLIFTDKYVIAVHNDSDFWIADEETWFAAGKQKVSPIAEILKESAQRSIHPILYLGQTNILDLEIRRTQWSESGITVITNLNELK